MRKPVRVALWLTPVALVAGLGLLGAGVNSAGLRFYNTGKTFRNELNNIAHCMKARDFSGIESRFAAGYTGNALGLNVPQKTESKDGVDRLIFHAGSPIDRTAGIAEWKTYLDSFDSIEDVALHVYELDKWMSQDQLGARVRFEVIGKLKATGRQTIDRGIIAMNFKLGPSGLEILSESLVEGDRYIAGDKPHFENVAHEAGIDVTNQYYPEFIKQKLRFAMIKYGPGGIAAADFDNDGFYDIMIPDGVETRLFRNLGDGHFDDVTAKAGLAGLDGVSTAIFADYDNDGFKDLFVSRTFKPNQLFHNNGNGTFTDVTAKSGIGADCCTTVASWADYDNDGFIDLYVGRYLDPRKDIPTTFYARNGEPNQLYHNNGNGTFTNVTEKAGVGEVGLCLGTVFGDYNDDGYPDIYVVNDFGRKTLYKNNGNGTFTDVTVATGTLAYGAGMSANMADYDNDGRLDIYSTNIRSEEAWFAEWPTVARYMLNSWRQGVWVTDMPLYWQIYQQSGMNFISVFKQMASGNTLLHNKGDGTFEDTTEKTHANPPGWFWGAVFADYDNDGWQDIFAADGWVYNDQDTEIELDFLNNVVSEQKTYKTGIFFDPAHFGRTSWHGWERNRYMRNRGDGTFEEIGHAAGNDLMLNARGVAGADFWNRGVVDLAIAASTAKPALLRNDVGLQRHWLEVELTGTKSNRDAVGARVYVTVKGKKQMREVIAGDGYGSQSALRQHLGLGDAESVDELMIKWPRSGIVQKFPNVQGNRIVAITEGKDELIEKHYGKPVK